MADVPEPAWLPAATGAAGAAVGAFFLWLAQRLMGKAAVQVALNESFKAFTAAQTAEIVDLRAEIARLKGEVADLRQINKSYESGLRRTGFLPPLKPGQASIAPMNVIGGLDYPPLAPEDET